jgi:hypothetical protein
MGLGRRLVGVSVSYMASVLVPPDRRLCAGSGVQLPDTVLDRPNRQNLFGGTYVSPFSMAF